VSRVVNREFVLHREEKEQFVEYMRAYEQFCQVRVLTFCVMTNHYHLVIRTVKGNLSEGMRWLQGTWATRFNRYRNEVGRLFQGRFKSFLIQDDSYLLRLSCYIHRNPLRAGMVKRLSDYKWSSYPVYAYNKEPEDWANYQFILNMFQGDKRQKAEAYHKMVRQYSSEEKKTLEDLKCGLVFGSLSYLNEIRVRSNATPITESDVNIEFILKERSRELLTEEHRRYSLNRNNVLVEWTALYNPRVEAIGTDIFEYNNLLPIPQSVIDANTAAVMPQNPGYY